MSSQKEPVRTKYLGRHLMLKREFLEKLLRGEKRATIRLGKVKPKYKEMIVHSGGRPVAKIEITQVVYKHVKDLTDEDAREDGVENKEQLLDILRRMYKEEIRDTDIVSIIKFRLVQSLSEIDVGKPYGGLEPVDIARLALRCLEDVFDEDEIKILRLLTIYKSLRAVAVKLYGNINKRWIIRKVLRKAYRELLKRGLLRAKNTKNRRTRND